MHDYHLLELLAIGFALSLSFGFIATKIGLSPIVGYLISGFIVGPEVLNLTIDKNLIHQLSEAGVILLMFGVGLHFDTKDLLAVKGVALPGALIQSTVATLCGLVLALNFNMTTTDGLILGIGLAVASTVVLLRVLTDSGMLDSVHGHVAVGWLVVEDILTVLILVLLPSIASTLTSGQDLNITEFLFVLGKALLSLTLLWLLVLVIGGKVVPWVLTKVARTRSQELFTLTVLVAAFATAVGAAVFFNASMALGAFLGGMVVGKSSLSHQAGADLLPLRDAFAVLFFLSVGMLFNPHFIFDHYLLILTCLIIVLVVKPLTALLAVTLLGYSAKTALTVAISLSQVGEFSFILAQQASGLKLISEDVYYIIVTCALISITVNPIFFKMLPKIEQFLQKKEKLWQLLNSRADKKALGENIHQHESIELEQHDLPISIVVGYGPGGKQVTQTLLDAGFLPVVIEMNVDTVNEITQSGGHAIFGDASKRDILHAADIDNARYLIITIPNTEITVAIAAVAKTINPKIRTIARVRFLDDAPHLLQAGVFSVAFEETEVAKALTNLLIEDFQSCKPENEDIGTCMASFLEETFETNK